jgi:hypothetical protein
VSTLHRSLDELVAYPPHLPRKASRTYAKTHHHLIYEMDAPCWICGIRHSTGGAMETHHYRFEWAAQFGLDLKKVQADFPDLDDRETLAEWVDSEANMLVLCAAHHRGKHTGIHMVSYPAWVLQRYEGDFSFIDQHSVPKAHTPLMAEGDPFPAGPPSRVRRVAAGVRSRSAGP